MLAVSAGLLWAASDTSIKALSSHLSQLGFGVLLHPLAFVILVASLVGLLISARSLQLGDAVPMIALTSAAANLTTIAAGPIVFAEPLPASRLGLAVTDPGVRVRDRRRRSDPAAGGGARGAPRSPPWPGARGKPRSAKAASRERVLRGRAGNAAVVGMPPQRGSPEPTGGHAGPTSYAAISDATGPCNAAHEQANRHAHPTP